MASNSQQLRFMFVNKDKESLALSFTHSSDGSSIRSFVQRRNTKPKRPLPESSARVLVGWRVPLPVQSFSESVTSSQTVSVNLLPVLNLLGREELQEQQEQHVIERDGQSPFSVNDTLTAKTTCGPLTLLSQAPTDAFRSYPLPWKPRFDEVAHFVTHSLGSIVFGYPTDSKFDIIRDRDFPIALGDPATFHALLLSAGTYFDYFQGLPQYNATALWHKNEAVKLVNRRLEHPVERSSEGTLHAVALIASIEHKWGFGHEVHVRGLHSLIVSMGGLKELRKRPRLEHTLFSFGLTNPGIAGLANLAVLESVQYDSMASQTRDMLASEFWSFLVDMAIYSVSNPRPFELYAPLLKPGSAIYKLLTAPTWHATPLRPEHSVRIHERIRVNTLIYIHCTILKAQSQGGSDTGIEHLKWLLQLESSWIGSLRMLQYLLVKEESSVNLSEPDLAWKSLRLLSVMEWLKPAVFVQATKYLLDLLTIGGQMTLIDLEHIRDDLFSSST